MNVTKVASSDREPEDPDGPLWYTFTFPLPFTLGLGDEGAHLIGYNPEAYVPDATSAWRDVEATTHFGEVPIVRIRFFQQPIDGVKMFPAHADAVILGLYGGTLGLGDKTPPLLGEAGAYEQWVSLEVPGSRLVWEPTEDRAYAFHRGFHALNDFLSAYILTFGSTSVQLVTTEQLGRLVFRGAIDTENKWHSLGPLMMHPEKLPAFIERRDTDANANRLAGAVASVLQRHPFVPAKLWRWRAHSALLRGDHVDRVISLQTSIESMLYATWQMTMVDDRKTAAEIGATLASEVPFKSLLTKTLPPILGGSWDVTSVRQPVGHYWTRLYMLRNRIVHAGYQPTLTESEAAEAAYLEMRKFLNERVWAKRRKIPRTALARVGDPKLLGLPTDKWIDTFGATMTANEAPYTWWLPFDVAGRP